jgi:hypothetical protein
MAEKSSWDQANSRQKLCLVWRNRKKISQIIKEYFYLPFFLLIILCYNTSTWGPRHYTPSIQVSNVTVTGGGTDSQYAPLDFVARSQDTAVHLEPGIPRHGRRILRLQLAVGRVQVILPALCIQQHSMTSNGACSVAYLSGSESGSVGSECFWASWIRIQIH